jgi:hypothetical protein
VTIPNGTKLRNIPGRNVDFDLDVVLDLKLDVDKA